MDFRNHYKVVETRYYDGSGHYEVHFKRWYHLWFRPLKINLWYDFFCDLDYRRTKRSLIFDDLTAAIGFAKDHATRGFDAFFESKYTETTTDLGRLP